MEPVNAKPPPVSFMERRSRTLAVRTVKRIWAGRNPAPRSCRVCGRTAPCRPYDFKARRHLRFAERGELGANTTWIMAKHDDLTPGSGAICAGCMESFLEPFFAHALRNFLLAGVVLCAPLPIFLLAQRRGLHAMSNAGFLTAGLLAVLFLVGLAALAAGCLADWVLMQAGEREALLRIAALEREPLRERFPAETYALQIGLRFSDRPEAPGDEVISCDDKLVIAPGAETK